MGIVFAVQQGGQQLAGQTQQPSSSATVSTAESIHAEPEPFAHEVVEMVDPSMPMPPVLSDTAAADVSLSGIPMSHGLILAGILFAIGLCGVMVRRNFLFMLMSLEVMMNAAALAFVVAGSRWVNPDGEVMFIFILTLAAAEAAIGLAILLQFYHKRGHLNVDTANEMRG